jgi:hypothetical protein
MNKVNKNHRQNEKERYSAKEFPAKKKEMSLFQTEDKESHHYEQRILPKRERDVTEVRFDNASGPWGDSTHCAYPRRR